MMRKAIRLFLLCWLAFGVLHAATLNGTVKWAVMTTGSDANPGGFDPAATFATNLTCTSGNTASPVCSSTSYTFVSGDVGAWLFIESGTNWIPEWCKIASVAAGSATIAAGVGACALYGVTPPVTGLNTSAGVATVASPTSGVWGVDYSQQAGVQISYTDLTVGATTTQFTSVLHPVAPNIVGNTFSVVSGSGCTVDVREVVSVSGTTATANVSLGTAASICTASLGGAKATVCGTYSGGCASGAFQHANPTVNGTWVYLQAGTYNQGTVTMENTNSTGSDLAALVVGYGTIPGDYAARPVIQTSTNANVTIYQLTDPGPTEPIGLFNVEFAVSGTFQGVCAINAYGTNTEIQLYRFKLDTTAETGTGCCGIVLHSDQEFSAYITDSEFSMTSNDVAINDQGSSGGGGILSVGWSYIHGAQSAITDDNVSNSQQWIVEHNVFANNGRAIYSQAGGLEWSIVEGNAFYNTTNENFRDNNTSTSLIQAVNNVFYGGTYGFYTLGGPGLTFTAQNAFGNVSASSYFGLNSSPFYGLSDISLGACVPFNNPSGNDFSLSSCGKTALQSAGFPGTTAFGVGYLAVGPLQPQSSSGTGVSPHAYVQ